MSDSFLWEPAIFTLGCTRFDADGFEDWIRHNDLEIEAFNSDTPLSRLWASAEMDDDDCVERMIEFGGRHCYRAWDKGRDLHDYIRNIIDMEHGSVLEHSSINLAMQGVSRSLSHELVRHRVGVAISQESQRYVAADLIKFVVPPMVAWLNGGAFESTPIIEQFADQCEAAREEYKALQSAIIARLVTREASTKSRTMQTKRANEAARSLLPNASETRLLWSPNMRLLRHFLWLRGGSGADLEIRRLACAMLEHAQKAAPSIFWDMTTSIDGGDYGVPVIVAP